MSTFAIPAEAHSDDYVIQAKFDALRYFQEATAEEIVALARCEFGGDYPADEVADFLSEDFEGLGDLFKYLDLKPTSYGNAVGFECHIEQDKALAWLKVHRPEIYDCLVREDLIDLEDWSDNESASSPPQ
jgi:hypothetical protein